MTRSVRPPRFESGFRSVSRGKTLGRVLLVTDDKLSRLFLAQILRTGGYEVCITTTGADAFARVMEGNEGTAAPIDLVLTDLEDTQAGLELASALRSAAARVGLLLSSRGLSGNQRDLAAFYGVEVLEAPFTPDLVCDCVKRALVPAA